MNSHIKKDYCDVPRIKRSRRGTLWVCDCGKAYLARLRNYHTDCGYRGTYVWVEVEAPKEIDNE